MTTIWDAFALWGCIAAALVAYNAYDSWSWKRRIKRCVAEERRAGRLR